MFRAYGSKLFGAIAGFGPARDGAIIILVALLLPILIGGMALVVDLSRAANLQTELQGAADAAALAGATQLDLSPGSRARAIQAAAQAGDQLVENSQRFGDSFESVVDIDDTLSGNTDIRFFSALPNTLATSDDTARFIEVNLAPRTVTFLFAGFMNAVDASPTARAVGGYELLACTEQPIFMCNPDEPSGGDAAAFFDVENYLGSSISIGDDEFGFLSVNGDASLNTACGNLARIDTTKSECLVNTVDGSLETVALVNECLNVRFDVYPDGGGPGNALAGARTDLNFSPAVNVVKGLFHADQTGLGIPPGSQCALHDEWVTPLSPYVDPTHHTSSTLPDTMTYPNDNCTYGVGPACSHGEADQIGFGVWDIGTYAATQHFGGDPQGSGPSDPGPRLQDDVNSWLNGEGLDFNGDNNTGLPSRYEVYLWELDDVANFPSKPDAVAACSTQLAPPDEERRVVTVAVVNCNAVGGSISNAPLATPRAVDLFLTEPMGASASTSFYAEIIGRSKERKRVVLYE